MQIKVSIIVAAYNAEHTIRHVLTSVLNQKFSEWECIVVDGASSDQTVSVAAEFSSKDNRFRIISEPDRGVYDAFNKGWQHAKGEWIYYLGCDDELLPNGIKALVENSKDVDFVYGDFVRRYKNGKTKNVSSEHFEKVMPYSLATSHQAMMMKRALIKKVGGFNLKYRILADYDLINHAYYLGMSTKKCEEKIAIFQVGGLSTDNLSSLRERYEILTSYKVPKYKAFFHCCYMGLFFILCKVKHNFLDA